MRIEVFEDPAEFLAKTDTFLLREEAQNNLILSFASMLVQSPGLAHNFFARVIDSDNNVTAAALWVPGRKLLLSPANTHELRLVADALMTAKGGAEKLDGLYAPKSTAKEFSELWAKVSGKVFELGLEQLVMGIKLEEAKIPSFPPGRFRRAWLEDLRLLRSWALAMAEETNIEEDPKETAELTKRMIEARRLFVWDNGGVRAMGGLSGNTPNSARVNSIYVPPEQRRKGYARACTYSIGAQLMHGTKTHACLFVDSKNPVSRTLYENLGYQAVGTICDYRPSPAAGIKI